MIFIIEDSNIRINLNVSQNNLFGIYTQFSTTSSSSNTSGKNYKISTLSGSSF